MAIKRPPSSRVSIHAAVYVMNLNEDLVKNRPKPTESRHEQDCEYRNQRPSRRLVVPKAPHQQCRQQKTDGKFDRVCHMVWG